MNRAIKERRRPFNIGTQSSHYISILLYRVLWTVLHEKKNNVGKWKCKGTIRQLSCIKEIQLQLMSTWWALFLVLCFSRYKTFVIRQHSYAYWLICALHYIVNKQWLCFMFLIENFINYLQISSEKYHSLIQLHCKGMSQFVKLSSLDIVCFGCFILIF